MTAYAPWAVRISRNAQSGRYTLSPKHVPPSRNVVIELPSKLAVRGAEEATLLHSLAVAACVNALDVTLIGGPFPVRDGIARVVASARPDIEVTQKGPRRTSNYVLVRGRTVPTQPQSATRGGTG